MTLEELYNKVMSDRDIMAEFVKASGTGTLVDFADQYDCHTTDSEIRDYFIAKCGGEGELDDDAVEAVSGGAFDFCAWLSDLFNSIFGGAGSSNTSASTTTKNSVIGGGRVKVTDTLPKDKIVSKGIAPASGNLSMDSICKKL